MGSFRHHGAYSVDAGDAGHATPARVPTDAGVLGGRPSQVERFPGLAGGQSQSLKPNNWVNYNDLTRPHPKWWLMWGIAAQLPYFRLVKYYNSPRKRGRDCLPGCSRIAPLQGVGTSHEKALFAVAGGRTARTTRKPAAPSTAVGNGEW